MEKDKQAILIADLGFGDAGKGSLTDFLTRQFMAHTVIRYNGGAQAGHDVLTADGRAHVFSQFGSGTFVDGVKTHLSRFILVDPLSMLKEERGLQDLGISDAFDRTTINEDCPIITPFHQAANRLLILSEGNPNKSTGRGINEVVADQFRFGKDILMAGDLENSNKTKRKLQFLREVQLAKIKDLRGALPQTPTVEQELRILDDPEVLDYCLEVYQHFASLAEIVDENFLRKLFSLPGSVVFEGAQGVLLDQRYGFYPFITKSNATFQNADSLLLENAYNGQTTKLGVIRAYGTRHGAGPFPTEDTTLSRLLPDSSNVTNPWQGNFRVGYLDLVTLRYAAAVLGPIEGLALTHLDRLAKIPDWQVCNSYSFEGIEPDPKLYFDGDHSLVKAIRVWNPTTTSHQQRLGELLNQCQPNYVLTDNQESPDNFVQLVEDLTNLPVAITSSGPTAEDKRMLHERI